MENIYVKSMQERLPMEVIYINKHGIITQRMIRVLRYNDAYIKGYCYTKRHIRTFKRDNILSVDFIRSRMGA